MKSLYVLFFAAAMSVTGCKDLKDIAGSYIVMNIDGQDISQDGVTLDIAMKDGENNISGNNSCNDYSSSFNISEDATIEIDPIMTTKMYCVEKAAIEKAYMKQLNKVHKVQLKKDILELIDDKGNVVITAKKNQ